MTDFAHAVREELWSGGRLLESRLSHGEARADAEGILATDARDDTFVGTAEREIDRLRAAMPAGFTVRLVAESGTEGTTATMIVRDGPLSIVTDLAHLDEDLALLRSAASQSATSRSAAPRSAGFQPAATPASSRPLLWQNGTAAILLHELLGHPLEHALPGMSRQSAVGSRQEKAAAPADCRLQTADSLMKSLPSWLHADIPLAMRRATFRDVPLLRMQHVRVSQQDAPFSIVDDSIDIILVDGGNYDPLTDTVTIHVAASSIGPFTLREPRTRFAFLGARGEPIRYPGVICSREGQELVVGSVAPVLLTELR